MRGPILSNTSLWYWFNQFISISVNNDLSKNGDDHDNDNDNNNNDNDNDSDYDNNDDDCFKNSLRHFFQPLRYTYNDT
jgi:hypothetical protein